MTYNENGYTKDEIENLVNYLEDGQDRELWENTPEYSNGLPILSSNDIDMIIEALEFYKEMNYQ